MSDRAADLEGSDHATQGSDDIDSYKDWCHELSAVQKVGKEILEDWRNQCPNSPRDYPTARWLTDNGYSHLRWVLSQKHDMGTPEFFTLLTSSGGENEYEWHISDVATIKIIREYLDEQVECRDWRDSTRRTVRSRINIFLQRFSQNYEGAAVVTYANDLDRQQELYGTFKRVVKDLRNDFNSDESVSNYLRATHRFLEWLERSGRIEYDPMKDIEQEFAWNRETEPSPLTEEQIRRLWIAAETDEERILVIGYCVWGVRTKELPAVSIDQLDLTPPDPVVRFNDRDRKNGCGEVSLMFGLDSLANLLDERARQPNWNGYLFPSPEEDQPFLCAKQVRRRFKDLCRRANVTIEGSAATPKHGRSFYYNIMFDAEADILDVAAQIADVQGAKDPESVRDYYLTDESQQRYARIFFEFRIRNILPDDAYSNSKSDTGFNTSLNDFD